MAVVTLALFKKHVRADEFSDDDDLLQHYLSAAEAAVIRETHRTETELTEIGGGESVPAPIQQAVLMLAGNWYNQRESVSVAQMHEVPYSIQALIKPYRKLADYASRTDEI